MTLYAGPLGIDLGEDRVPMVEYRSPAQSGKSGFFTPQTACPIFATNKLEESVGKLVIGNKIWAEPMEQAIRIYRTDGPAFLTKDCQ